MIETLFSGVVGDGDTISPLLDRDHERGYLSIIFYSDPELTAIVTPSAGTVTATASESGDIYGTIMDGTIAALDVGPLVTYQRPNWAGQSRFVKINMSGIVGANFFKCNVYKFGGIQNG